MKHEAWPAIAAALADRIAALPRAALLATPATGRLAWIAEQLTVSEDEALAGLASFLGMQPISAMHLHEVVADFSLASFSECERRECVLARPGPGDEGDTGAQLLFICHDPFDLGMQDWCEPIIERERPALLRRMLARREDLLQFLADSERGLRAMDTVAAAHAGADAYAPSSVLQLSMSTIEGTASPVVRLVDSTLYDALKIGASDIHFEVQQKALTVKYRLDGVLQEIKQVDSLHTALQVISRVKVLADLDISEHRIPQDGRFRVVLEAREIDFRVSIMPNAVAEDAVLRILDRKHLAGDRASLTLDALSFEPEVIRFIRQSARLPYGLLLVTGPTGSGKTTTLYAAISEINTGLDKIVTIEDPIEYQLGGVLQIPVNERKGLTFAKGLRSILRHDPDKIMVGEIRDSETAQIAVQAALTGHQVFTTVHANNVFDVIGRFSNMGVDSYSLVAALTGIVAQRLVRRLCTSCAVASADAISEIGATGLVIGRAADRPILMRGRGCPNCRGSGYRGRAAIAETLPIDDDMKDLLVQHAPISAIKRMARDKGFKSLRDSALALAMGGVTSLDEVARVTPMQ